MVCYSASESRSALFRGRHFRDQIVVLLIRLRIQLISLSPKWNLTAAGDFRQLIILQVGERWPRVINVDGYPAYPSAIEQLPTESGLSMPSSLILEQHSRTRPSLHKEARGGVVLQI
jgi:hypothetical protein